MPPSMWTDGLAGSMTAYRFDESPDEITSFTCWAHGYIARYLDRMPEKDAMKIVVKSVEEARPAAKGKIEAAAIKSWGLDPFSGGKYMDWAPGQIHELLNSQETGAALNQSIKGLLEFGLLFRR